MNFKQQILVQIVSIELVFQLAIFCEIAHRSAVHFTVEFRINSHRSECMGSDKFQKCLALAATTFGRAVVCSY